MEKFVPAGIGWVRDLPDPRDYRATDATVRELLSGLPRRSPRANRTSADHCVEFLPPAEPFLGLWGVAGQAVDAMVGCLTRAAHGHLISGSALFLHTMAQRMAPRTSGSASLRATLKSLKRFGLPPREHWPNDAQRREDEPPGFLFAYAREFADLVYVRLDAAGVPSRAVLATVKAYLAAGLPVGFGFAVFDSATAGADVPFPSRYDAVVGSQTVVAIGYDDGHRVCSERGALRIRGPWGPTWGEDGNGWLPYRYVTDHLAGDFWSLLRPDWLAHGHFTAPL